MPLTSVISNEIRESVVFLTMHFLGCYAADHSLLEFKLIDQLQDHLRECENFWIATLLINQRSLRMILHNIRIIIYACM